MNYKENILELIGGTPLVKINNLAKDVKPLVLAKLEYLNPGGSVKDRIAVKMIDNAEEQGLIKKNGTIIEPTSGNTGAGLAIVAANRGYKMIFTMTEKIAMEKEDYLRSFGADVIRCPTEAGPEDPKSYYKLAEKLVDDTKNSFSPNQYFNKNNPLAHYETTGPEIWDDTDGKITHFVTSMGTGGTISGVGKFLKEKNKKIKIIGADPVGSLYYSTFYDLEHDIHQYLTEGIGEDFMPETMDLDCIDDIIQVSDQETFDMARRLVREEGLPVGESSGTTMHAALEYAEDLKKEDIMVVLLPDSSKNYLSTLFNDKWMKDKGLLKK